MRQFKVNAMSQALLIKLLLNGVYSCRELAEETGLHYVTILEYTRALAKVGAAHISSWDKDSRGRDVIKIYKLGPGRDAKRDKLTSVQRQQRRRDKQRAAEQAAVVAGIGRYVKAANGRLRFERIESGVDTAR
jgi:predicted ArsR family transcriptional regulator